MSSRLDTRLWRDLERSKLGKLLECCGARQITPFSFIGDSISGVTHGLRLDEISTDPTGARVSNEETTASLKLVTKLSMGDTRKLFKGKRRERLSLHDARERKFVLQVALIDGFSRDQWLIKLY